MRIAGVLLAAGRSTRFGAADKLTASLHGRPLALHAAATLATLPLAACFVVTGNSDLDWPGEVIVNDDPASGMARSIVLGVGAARRAGIDAVLITLADMPFVPRAHHERLIAAYAGPDTLVASIDGTRAMPPALFGAASFDKLEALTGDQGARALLAGANTIPLDPSLLLDIDTPEQLARAAALTSACRA